MTIVLNARGEAAVAARDGLWLGPDDAAQATGWTFKPEGMCRDDMCVPLDGTLLRDGRVDVEAFWRRFGNPVLRDAAGEVWLLGAGAEARNDALARLEAPDFTLSDAAGVSRTLSDLRGKKVLLATWASW